jgi:hypothetical protein
LRHQIAFEQDLDFEVSASTFLSEIIKEIPDELFNDYRKGIVSDSDLWNSIINYQKEKVKSLEDNYFIISNNVLTAKELIGKISSNKIDQAIVEDILGEDIGSIILDNFTLSNFTEYTWDLAGSHIVSRINSGKLDDYNGENSLELLRELYNNIVKESLTSDFPRFRSLSEPLKLLDDTVRMLKSGEKNDAIKLIETSSSNNNMTKSVSWAILICLNAISSRAWKYSKEEQSLGQTLKSSVQELIDSPPSDYLGILEDISTRIGLGNKLEVI